MRKILPLTNLFLAIALLLAGCARPASSASILMSDVQRDTKPQVADSDLTKIAAGNNNFAYDLFHALQKQPGNLFFSPYSLSSAAAMLYAGARGETEEQIARVFHFPFPQSALHPAFNALNLQLASPEGEGVFQLQIANALWGQQSFPFKQEYLDVLAKNYGAGMRLADFTDSRERERARQNINDWVKDETRGKIEELIKQGMLNDYTRLVLANAIYFKGEWEQPFRAEPDGLSFTLNDGSSVKTPGMSRRGDMRYAEADGIQVVELTYKDSPVSMLILLPAAGQYEAVEGRLDAAQVERLLASLQPGDLKLYMPKFSYSSEFALESTLKDLGMGDAFDQGRADLTGMYDREKAGANLFLSHVIHKAFVAVDEKGTEAAAATGMTAEIVSMPQELRIDHPFIFLIRDSQSGAVLFLGRVLDPR